MIFFCFISRVKGFKSAAIFDGISEALKNDGANLVKKVKGIFGFKVKDTNGNEVLWIVDAKNGSGKVEVNGSGKGLISILIFDFLKFLNKAHLRKACTIDFLVRIGIFWAILIQILVYFIIFNTPSFNMS